MDVLGLDIVRVYEVNNARDANNFLKCGWKALIVEPCVCEEGSYIRYCMAWLAESGKISYPSVDEIGIHAMDEIL